LETTPNLGLPNIMSAQAQTHVTHNEALRVLDAMVQLSVLDRNRTAPPADPAEGDRYIVAAGGAGAWAGKDGSVAAFQDGGWAFHAPREGWTAWVADEDRLVAWDGGTWRFVDAGLNPAPLVGINATADTTNRLSLSAPASLFNHEGAGHQLKLNKAASGETASLLYQTGFSGRAEMGLAGDDHFHVKVSPDGSAWNEALVVDKGSARVGLGTDAPQARLHCRVAPADNGVAFVMTGKGKTSTDDPDNGVALVLAHNAAGNRQFFFGSTETGIGVRITNAGIDGYNYITNARINMSIGTDTTDVTAARNLTVNGVLHTRQWARVGSYTVTALPAAAAAGAGAIAFVSDEAGGAVLAFCDGASWRRATDRAVVS